MVSIIIISAVAVYVGFVIVRNVKRVKKGQCCGDCGSCTCCKR